ncbi:hypothetical protein [uncultured Tateyamaria sp.]|uniref:DODA-type extradiol aromatic ring-opening family dioxygenase n=1 Tax=uncultured Tateyamaria sp. TaxID=455651 RepID=UPI0026162A4A|nr:hypothetical protein [uncultured Tateyamaria sp.]
MAKIVSAYCQSHIMFNPDGAPEQCGAVFDAYKEVGEGVRNSKPDVIVILTGDHYFNVKTDIEIPLAVSVGAQHTPFGDMDIPKKPFKGHPEFAQGFINFATEKGFDLGKLHEEGFAPDHGVAMPVMFSNPTGEIPTIVINMNINMSPVPTPRRVFELGRALREYIDTVRPDDERVAVLATGGLSHWLNVEGDGKINEEWDRETLKLFADGRGKELADKSADWILENAGNGGLEMLFWVMMAGVIPEAKGREIFYEPIYSWKTGMGAVEMQVAA